VLQVICCPAITIIQSSNVRRSTAGGRDGVQRCIEAPSTSDKPHESSGGHGEVIVQLLKASAWEVKGVYDDNEEVQCSKCMEVVSPDRLARLRLVAHADIHLKAALAEGVVYSGATHSMLSHLASLNYDTYVIDELAGIPWDVRNLLCLPREANLIARSPALAAALATQKLVPTDRTFSHVLPCCSRRGACCRNPASGCCLDLATVRRVEPSAARLIKPVHLLRKA